MYDYDIEIILQKLLDYFDLDNMSQLADKLSVSQPTISKWKSRGSILPIKKICRELGIYNEIFGDSNSKINTFHNTNFSGNSSGVDNSNNKNINSNNNDLDCDDFTKSLFKQLCNVYKDKKTELQTKLFELIQNEQSNK
ncbi:helix-turn-helix domain-containing protein [Aliarcobacter butzleri]|uniref:helix-turn-helix domain-containing protein n=1 Tax=Aliarcobacter butzleri TaxID=28197 RepID=UPI0021B18C1A|nr:helix-turn-helix transcriptional regulator [Aliarcobacter butzleri]MCT7620492.1 helix-turn-helix transcriptional regulator [Aliarcobacter butzleri]